MAESTADRRQCPTRSNGAAPLIAHWITPPTCLERQRRNYHKCFTCLYRGLGANQVLPVLPALPVPRIAPAVRAPVSEAV